MRIIKDTITWIDILGPTKDDTEVLKKQYGFHPIILDELLQLSARSRVELYDDYLYLTYHLPVYDPALKTSRRTEVDFLITRDTVITVHYEDLEPIDAFLGLVNADQNFHDRALGKSSLLLTYYLVQSLLNFSLRQLHHIEENIRSVSLEIFKGGERKLLERISYIKRDLLDYHLISRPQKILLNSFLAVAAEFWGASARIYIDDLIGDDLKIQQQIENFLEVIQSHEETNAQLLNVKINRTMQVFTVLAFFTFPLVLFTSIYAVEKRGQEFWFGFLTVAVITILLSFILLRKKEF